MGRTQERPDPTSRIEGWLRAAREGDRDALGRALEAFRARLLDLARPDPKLRAKGNPSDLVQETFLAARQNFSDFRGATVAEFAAWLAAILRHRRLNFVRRFRDA